MSGQNQPEYAVNVVPVSDRLRDKRPVTGVTVEESEVAMRVTDCGSRTFSVSSCAALQVTTTATSLADLNTNKEDVVARRGFQFKASAANTADIVIGGKSVAANATDSSINGMPLSPGESIFIEVTHLSEIFGDSVSGTQVLHWLAY